MKTFDRYSILNANGKIEITPFIEIKKNDTDIYLTYTKNKTRLDKISYQYYGSPDYAWLIMQANPEYGSIENFIPNEVTIRIPYPLQDVLNRYIEDMINYKKINEK